MTAKGTIKYPRVLNYYDIIDVHNIEDCVPLAEAEHCNPWTVRECISCIRALTEGKTVEAYEQFLRR